MRNLYRGVLGAIVLLLLLLTGLSVPHAQAQANDQIYGIWFYQQQDDVKIVSYNHVDTNVTDETFGLSYTQAATQGCIDQGYPPQYLVRYRQEPDGTWVVYCYTDATAYVVIAGSVFGQATIDAAVCRAQQIVYGTCTGGKSTS